MKIRHMDLKWHWLTSIAALTVYAAVSAVPPSLAQTVTCDETTLSVTAVDVKAEDLIKAVGNECDIKMVARGEVFTEEDTFSVRFENMTIRTGIERILRVINVPNHMMHFEETGSQKRLKEITLVGQKGGEQELTAGRAPEALPDDQEADASEKADTETASENETKPPEAVENISPADRQQAEPDGPPDKTERASRWPEENKAPENIRRRFENLMKQ